MEWLQLAWPPSWQNANIAAKELLPIVLSLALWGSHWLGSRVLFRTDNQVVVAALMSFSACDPTMSHLLRCLFFFEAHFDVEHIVVHLPGRDNPAADAISHNKVDQFNLCPQASPIPKAIPTSAVSLIMDTSPLGYHLAGVTCSTILCKRTGISNKKCICVCPEAISHILSGD